ncbi:hypothetical protein GS876_23420 [Rhodococcus hoagii]|nr:hypothetical protein [Prescottella equi]
MFAGAIGTPPPAWRGVPPAFLDKGRDMTSKFRSDRVENLVSLLGVGVDKAKSGFGLFRDQGGWIPMGSRSSGKRTGKPRRS